MTLILSRQRRCWTSVSNKTIFYKLELQIWDNVKRLKIRIIGVPEEEDKKKDSEKILEEIIVENFPKMGKEIITQVQETKRVPNRINPR